MKYFVLLIAQPLSLLLLITTATKVQGRKTACYITPSKLSPQDASPCSQLNYHYYYKCNYMTIDEIVDVQDPESAESENHDLILFLPGIHNVQETRAEVWNIPSSENGKLSIAFRGIGNVTVFCKKQFAFILRNIESVSFSGIHVQNCSGLFKYYHVTFLLIAHQKCNVSVTIVDIKITSINSALCDKHCEGIFARFKKGSYVFNIMNSVFSIRGIGVNIHHDNRYFKVAPMRVINIAHVLFTGCLWVESRRSSIDNYNVVNVTFVDCANCSTALSIKGIKNFTLSNVTFTATRSQNVLNCSSSSLYVQGYWDVSHNSGGVAITGESMVIFSKAVVKFTSNNIQDNKRHDSIVSVDFKSTLSFNTPGYSRVIFTWKFVWRTFSIQ